MRKLFLIGEEKRKGRSEANTKLETTCVFYFTQWYTKRMPMFYCSNSTIANSFKKFQKYLNKNLPKTGYRLHSKFKWDAKLPG